MRITNKNQCINKDCKASMFKHTHIGNTIAFPLPREEKVPMDVKKVHCPGCEDSKYCEGITIVFGYYSKL